MGTWTWRAVVGTSATLRADLRLFADEQGREFAAQSAISSIVRRRRYFDWVGCTGRARAAIRLAMRSHALSVFVLEMMLLHPFRLALWPAFDRQPPDISATLWFVPKPRPDQTNISYPRWDLPARMIAATGLVLLIRSQQIVRPDLTVLLSRYRFWLCRSDVRSCSTRK